MPNINGKPKRLVRPQAGRMVAGVALGLANYLNIDVTVMRLLWVFLSIFTGFFPGIVLYVAAWVVIPEEHA